MKNIFRFVSLVGGVVLTFGVNTVQSKEKPKPVELATAPSGAFHLEAARINGGQLSVVPKDAPRQVLPPARFMNFKPDETPAASPAPANAQAQEVKGKYEEITTDKLEFLPLTFISPDDRWIYVAQTTSDEPDIPDTIGYLYRRVPESPDAAPKFELATNPRLDILAFRFLVSEERLNAQHPGEPEEKGISTGSVYFVAWSPDSARLLVALDYITGEFPNNIGHSNWLCYFNTRTGAFERTERLRVADRIVLQSPDLPDHVIPGSAAEVLHAESLGQEGPFIPAKERFAKADKELNAIYQQLMKRLDPPAQHTLRQEEREWISQREMFSAVHTDQSWSPYPEACHTDWLAVATEARTAELSRRLLP